MVELARGARIAPDLRDDTRPLRWPGAPPTPLEILGTRLQWWWQVGLSPETLSGSLIAQLNDLSTYGRHGVPVGTVAANAPTKGALGSGPRADLYSCEIIRTGDSLWNVAVSRPAGEYWSFLSVHKASTDLATRFTSSVRSGGAPSVGNRIAAWFSEVAPTTWRASVTTASGVEEDVLVTSPARDAAWLAWGTRFRAGVVPRQTCGPAVCVPTAVGTGACWGIESFGWGKDVTAGGSVHMFLAGSDVTDAEWQGLCDWVLYSTGLPLI